MPLQHQSFLHSHCQSRTNLPTQCQSCQSQTNLLPIHDQSSNRWPIKYRSLVNSHNSMTIYNQFNPSCQYANSMPIHYKFCIDLLIHHQSKNMMPILDRSTNPPFLYQSTMALPTNQSNANPQEDCQSWTNSPIKCQSLTKSPIQCQSITDPQIMKKSHSSMQALVNPSSKFGDQLATNLGTRVLWRPTEVSWRRTNSHRKYAFCQSGPNSELNLDVYSKPAPIGRRL